MSKSEITLMKFGDPIKGSEEGVKRVVLETLANISKEAKSIAPTNKQKDGGRLRNSIMWRGPGLEGGFNDSPGVKADGKYKLNIFPVGIEGYVGSSVYYGPYVEFGTRHQKPQPFLRPAIATAGGMSSKDVKDAMNEEVKKWTKGVKTKKIKGFL